MSLGSKTLAIVAATVGGAVLLAYVVSSKILLSSFSDLQVHATRVDLQRALGALSNDLRKLGAFAGDWGRWDDTYRFVVDRNPKYIAQNITTTSFTELRLDHVIYLNRSGGIVYFAGYDLSKRRNIPASDPQHERIAAAVRRIHPAGSILQGISGIVVVDHVPTLVAAYPILTSQGTGPCRGTLVMARHLDSAQIKYLIETARTDVAVEPINSPNMPSDFRAAREALRHGKTFVRFIDARRSVGYTLVNDILGTPAMILRVTMPATMLAEGKTTSRWLLYSMLTVGVLFALASIVIMNRVVVARLFGISARLREVGRTSDPSIRLPVTGKDELSDVAATVNRMLESLEKAQDELDSRVEERTRDLLSAREQIEVAYNREHRIAEVLQKSLVEIIDIAHPEYEIAARYHPALEEAEVGGDFYDVFTLCGNRTAVVIGDVAGKGLAAAAFTAMTKYTLRAYAREHLQPGQVMERLNDAVCEYTPEDMFITVFFGVVDPAKGTFAYASAGHDPPLFFHASTDQITGIESTGLVIGVAEGESYHSGSIKLAPHDTLMLYTDGITDARNGGPRLGYDGMLEVFKANAGRDGSLIADAMLDAARQAAGDKWPDDAAVLVFKAGEAWVSS